MGDSFLFFYFEKGKGFEGKVIGCFVKRVTHRNEFGKGRFIETRKEAWCECLREVKLNEYVNTE